MAKSFFSMGGKPIPTFPILIAIAIVIIFFLVNVNEKLGYIFGIMLLADVAMKNIGPWNKSQKFDIERDNLRLRDLFVGIAAYGIFILVVALITPIFQGLIFNAPQQSVFASMAAQTPVLADSQVASFIGWGVLIPIVETSFFFGSVLLFSAYVFNVKLSSLKNWKVWAVILLVAVLFATFHLTARAQAVSGGKISIDEVGMLATFIFGIMQGALVVWFKELTEAIYMHITSNSLSVAISMSVKPVMAVLGL